MDGKGNKGMSTEQYLGLALILTIILIFSDSSWELVTCVKAELEESVDKGVASLNSTVRQMLASYWSDS